MPPSVISETECRHRMTQTRTENKYGKKCWHVKGDCVGRPLPDMRHFTQPLADFRSWHHFKAPPRVCNIGLTVTGSVQCGEVLRVICQFTALCSILIRWFKMHFLVILKCPFLLGYTNRRRKRYVPCYKTAQKLWWRAIHAHSLLWQRPNTQSVRCSLPLVHPIQTFSW